MTPRARALPSRGSPGCLKPIDADSTTANAANTPPAMKNGVSDVLACSASRRRAACSAAAMQRGPWRRDLIADRRRGVGAPGRPRSGSRSPRPGRGSGCRARGGRTGARAGRVERHERELRDRLAGPQLDRHAREVRDLERERALPARVDEAGRRVDDEPEAARAIDLPSMRATMSSGSSTHSSVRPRHELAGVDDERLAVRRSRPAR